MPLKSMYPFQSKLPAKAKAEKNEHRSEEHNGCGEYHIRVKGANESNTV